MSAAPAALLYAFAVEPGLSPVAGAAPPAIVARQLPRLAVQALNRDGDRGVRYFPLVGVEGGVRRFLDRPSLLEPETAIVLHRQEPAPGVVVDGRLQSDGMHLRILGEEGVVSFDEVIEVDLRDPRAALTRLLYELMGTLHWPGAPPVATTLAGDALAQLMVGRDELLRLEANMTSREADEQLALALGVLELGPADPEAHTLVLDFAARLMATADGDVLGDALRRAAELVLGACAELDDRTAAFLDALAGLLASLGMAAAARLVSAQLAQRRPDHAEATCRAAGAAFAEGHPERARAILERALEAGARSPMVLAQLAVVEDRLGHAKRRESLIEELLRHDDLAPPITRIAVAYLLEHDRVDEAVQRLERVLAAGYVDASLLLDLGRALLHGERVAEAEAALARCLEARPDDAVRREAERHLALAKVPGALGAAREIDRALTGGDAGAALARARRLVRSAPALPEAWLLLGVTRQRLEQPRRAERALRRALQLRPGLGEAHNRLGILLVGRRRYREGHDHLSEAVELLPDEPSPWIHLAQACHYLGRGDDAREALAQAARRGADQGTVDAVRRAFLDEP